MTPISRLLREALCEGGENVPFPRAYHWHAVLFVSNVAEFVDAFGGRSGLFALFLEHGGQEIGDIIKLGWLGRSL